MEDKELFDLSYMCILKGVILTQTTFRATQSQHWLTTIFSIEEAVISPEIKPKEERKM